MYTGVTISTWAVVCLSKEQFIRGDKLSDFLDSLQKVGNECGMHMNPRPVSMSFVDEQNKIERIDTRKEIFTKTKTNHILFGRVPVAKCQSDTAEACGPLASCAKVAVWSPV